MIKAIVNGIKYFFDKLAEGFEYDAKFDDHVHNYMDPWV